ncbi:MAG: hypothetical protein P8X49_05190 [Syntrophobacterales bacterium]
MGKLKVLIVDDSAIVRKIFTEVLTRQPDLEVVGDFNPRGNLKTVVRVGG